LTFLTARELTCEFKSLQILTCAGLGVQGDVLVPMAGLGSRFLKEGFTVPKQLINIKDKQLIDISLDCLDTTDCNLIFIIRD
jgi:CTP:molybdopterin cytidylyltransferase MocA